MYADDTIASRHVADFVSIASKDAALTIVDDVLSDLRRLIGKLKGGMRVEARTIETKIHILRRFLE